MSITEFGSARSTRLLQLATTLMAGTYMLLIGGTFDATIRYRVQVLNWLAASVLAGAWVLARLRQNARLRPSGLAVPLLVFGLSQWVAVITSAQPRLSLDWAASITAWIAIFLVLHDVLSGGWPREFIINSLLTIAVILSADGVWAASRWYVGWAAIGEWPPVTFRYTGLLGHANLTACVLNMLLPIVIVKLLQPARPAARLPLALLAAAMLTSIFFTSSRAGWLAGGAALVVLGALLLLNGRAQPYWRQATGRWRALAYPLRWAVRVASLAAVVGAGWLLSKQAQHISHGSLLDSRRTFWSAAWQLFVERPLTGSGPDLFPWFYSRFESIPPDFFAPHAHSLVMQILSGSGLLGLAALLWLAWVAVRRLRQSWLATGRPAETAALLAALAAFAFQHVFDYLLGTPFVPFLLAVIAALALTPAALRRPAGRVPAVVMAPVLLLPMVVFAFALRAASWNEAALNLAAQGNWPESAADFQHAAAMDPGLTLYLEEAAYAQSRAGQAGTALPLWRSSAQADPHWALLTATVAAIGDDYGAAQAAQALAPRSYLYALNAGAIAERQNQTGAARKGYRQALALAPRIAKALYWQQNPLRAAILSEWQSDQPPDMSPLARGWQALAEGEADQAIGFFQQAHGDNPASNEPYLGLARAYMAENHRDAAERYLRSGLNLPVTAIGDTLELRLAAGDLAEAGGNLPAAMAAYGEVFSAVNDYTVDGPGTYGYPQRSSYVFHRQALPSDLVPELPRADITAEMDDRFARLAAWYRAAGQPETSCLILQRVEREAPLSVSGGLYHDQCTRPQP